MKRAIVAALGLTLAATGAFGQTNQVLSRNAVGYTKVNILSNRQAFIAHNFNYMGPGVANASNLFGTNLPLGTFAAQWNSVNQNYSTDQRTRSGWSPNTNTFTVGKGFFIRIPSTVTLPSFDLFLMGEVPDSLTSPTATLFTALGFTALGLPYPVSDYWTNTSLSQTASVGSILALWNMTNNNYETFTKTRSGWGTGTNVILRPGDGFFFRSITNAYTWTVPKPYTWP